MSRTILIVESEPWLGDHYQRQLEAQDFKVTRATNAYSAIDMIDETPPSAIIMSLALDGPGALGLLHELQSYTDTAHIPVIVCNSLLELQLEELEPYGVKQLLDTATMRPTDLSAAVRSVTFREGLAPPPTS